ncbi:MAG: acetate/propionate family kinase [Tepidisphaeraceae bacterium]
MTPTAAGTILTLNTGSSSLKAGLFQLGPTFTPLLSARLDRIGLSRSQFRVADPSGSPLLDRSVQLDDHDSAIRELLEWLRGQSTLSAVRCVGHRVVHGGRRFARPMLVTEDLLAELERLSPIVPDHLPHSINAIRSATAALPAAAQVACFDTGFFSGMPGVARTYGLPRELAEQGVVRYGFHGLSCEYIMHELRRIHGARGRVVIAHLGNGASVSAVRDEQPIDTSMGFTPTGGLVMGTRCGDLDPGVMLYLSEARGLGPRDLNELFNHRSGLIGVSQTSSDMRQLLLIEKSNARAAEAIELFCYTARKFIGALTAAMGGVEALVFTGGIGENAAVIRRRICEQLGHLGISLDAQANDSHAPFISARGSPTTVRVIKADEELMIARHAHGIHSGL